MGDSEDEVEEVVGREFKEVGREFKEAGQGQAGMITEARRAGQDITEHKIYKWSLFIVRLLSTSLCWNDPLTIKAFVRVKLNFILDYVKFLLLLFNFSLPEMFLSAMASSRSC